MGRWGDDTIRNVYDKTGGYCRYCGKKIAYVNYGDLSSRGSWEIEHSNPVSLGGTDYFRNLWPACPECNRAKGTMTGPQFLRQFGDAPARRASPWDGFITVILGAIAVGILLNWLSNAVADQ